MYFYTAGEARDGIIIFVYKYFKQKKIHRVAEI